MSYVSPSSTLFGSLQQSQMIGTLISNEVIADNVKPKVLSVFTNTTVAVQQTSRATAIATTEQKGKFQFFSAAGSATAADVVIQNTLCNAFSVPVVAQVSGTDKYLLQIVAVTAGSFTLRYTSSGTTTETPTFSYIIM